MEPEDVSGIEAQINEIGKEIENAGDEAFLLRLVAMAKQLAVWRMGLKLSGYSDYFIEVSAFALLAKIYQIDTRITFDPNQFNPQAWTTDATQEGPSTGAEEATPT